MSRAQGPAFSTSVARPAVVGGESIGDARHDEGARNNYNHNNNGHNEMWTATYEARSKNNEHF